MLAATKNEQENVEGLSAHALGIVVLASSAHTEWARKSDGMEHDDGTLANPL